jgi:hypothetical protein
VSFDLEKLFTDVFSPRKGEVVTVMYDLPHGEIVDNDEWADRRAMAGEWHDTISHFAPTYEIVVNPLLTIDATGSHNADLPQYGRMSDEKCDVKALLSDSTIVLAMTQFSASAPLFGMTANFPKLRAASMPQVMRRMERTALTADYAEIAKLCAKLSPYFEEGVGVDVLFSTGHKCYFDISNNAHVGEDTGLLPPTLNAEQTRIANLPAGEVYTCPNESDMSATAGEIPAMIDREQVIFVVDKNQIVDVRGESETASMLQKKFASEPALGNIAEIAIGVNDKAVVTGNVLEDEKAGFHWAYGRSDHLGGTVGVDEFSSPDKVEHQDIVYAKESPIVCSRFEFVNSDGSHHTVIVDGVIQL